MDSIIAYVTLTMPIKSGASLSYWHAGLNITSLVKTLLKKMIGLHDSQNHERRRVLA